MGLISVLAVVVPAASFIVSTEGSATVSTVVSEQDTGPAEGSGTVNRTVASRAPEPAAARRAASVPHRSSRTVTLDTPRKSPGQCHL
jgi:hypothetical protein